MLLLKLYPDCLAIPTRNKDGEMVNLSMYTLNFLLGYTFFCMGEREITLINENTKWAEIERTVQFYKLDKPGDLLTN